jgi:hypothetical protein
MGVAISQSLVKLPSIRLPKIVILVIHVVKKVKISISLLQAMEAHRVARG